MIRVSEPMNTVPESFSTPLQQKVYEMLTELEIPFLRVENDPAITMEDCEQIDITLNVKTVKTLFLTNRQKTAFYIFVTPGDKPFVTKNFGAALGVSRVSFAPEELMTQMIGTVQGACTVYGAMLDKEKAVRVVIDADVLKSEWYGCTDGTTTGYMKVKTEDILKKYIPYSGHEAEIIEL